MAIQSEKDAIFEGALTALKQRRVDAQQALSHELSGVMFGELLADIRADKDRNGVPDIMERGRQDAPRIVEPEQPRLTAADIAAFLSVARAVDPVSNSTHATQPTAHPAPGQGQGNGPAAPKLGADARNPTPRP